MPHNKETKTEPISLPRTGRETRPIFMRSKAGLNLELFFNSISCLLGLKSSICPTIYAWLRYGNCKEDDVPCVAKRACIRLACKMSDGLERIKETLPT